MDDDEFARQQKEKGRYQRVRDQDIDAAISALTEHKHGREFLWWLLEIGKVDQQPFTGHALSTSFQSGEINVGLQIKARLCTAAPTGFINMMKEKLENATGRPNTDPGPESGPQSDSEPIGPLA